MFTRASRPLRRSRALVSGGALLLLVLLPPAGAGAQQFDFDNAPIHASLPLDLTVNGVTAYFSATGEGFAIQPANTMGFTPAGFGGLCIYPSSVFPADLHIAFSVSVTDFSILYAPEEYGCDDSAILRVTAYRAGLPIGTATTTAPHPGTWPTGTLSYSDPAGFDAVVVQYDRRPACGDYGPIFMADVMTLGGATTAVPMLATNRAGASPNPFHASTEVRFTLANRGPVTATVHDAAGRCVRTLLANAELPAGAVALRWDGRDAAGEAVRSGVYFCRITDGEGARITRVVFRR